MSEQMTLALSVEKQVGSVKRIDYSFSKVEDVDGNHVIETILEAGSADTEFDLFVSALLTVVKFVIVESDQPLTVKLDSTGNTAIEVTDFMLLTGSPSKLYISVPGATDATVKIIYGGTQT